MPTGPVSPFWSALPSRNRAVLPLRVAGLFLAAWFFPGLVGAVREFVEYATRRPWEPSTSGGYFDVVEHIIREYFTSMPGEDVALILCMIFGFTLGFVLLFGRRLFWAVLRRFPR